MEFVEKFKRYLREDGKSPKTIESYIGDVAGCVHYLQGMGVKFNGELKRFYITSFRNYLIESRYEVNTINKKINSHLIKDGLSQEMVVDLRKDRIKVTVGSQKQVEVYSGRQVERILFYIQNGYMVSVRDSMIILLLMYTGVRVS